MTKETYYLCLLILMSSERSSGMFHLALSHGVCCLFKNTQPHPLLLVQLCNGGRCETINKSWPVFVSRSPLDYYIFGLWLFV